jgi:predicted nucleic acid-binding protein
MSGPEFLDTNVVVYAFESKDPIKQEVARDLVRQAMSNGFVSTQVLAELCATLFHKRKPPALPEEVATILDSLAPMRVIVPDAKLVRRAVVARAEYGLHFYDAMIVAAAERGRCRRIWSEDLSHGQQYFAMEVRNPFAG